MFERCCETKNSRNVFRTRTKIVFLPPTEIYRRYFYSSANVKRSCPSGTSDLCAVPAHEINSEFFDRNIRILDRLTCINMKYRIRRKMRISMQIFFVRTDYFCDLSYWLYCSDLIICIRNRNENSFRSKCCGNCLWINDSVFLRCNICDVESELFECFKWLKNRGVFYGRRNDVQFFACVDLCFFCRNTCSENRKIVGFGSA